MKKSKDEAKSGSDLHLGTLLGRRQAFSLVAARCSAADAACLREIRDQKSYRSLGIGWKEFCARHLGASHAHANRLIGYLNEFGPAYFDLAQLTGISPDEYRAIAPVKDQAIQYDGQLIALLPENAERLAAAVTQLRRQAVPTAAAPQSSIAERVRRLEQRTSQFVREISELTHAQPKGAERIRLASLLIGTREKLQRLETEFGPMV
ncbi:MAG: hypothetical protein C5B51_15840 [Terriglobia bacterium]|nr:MAG: hypothetical protein C5B51_15840 [Terriglobia bacterium]